MSSLSSGLCTYLPEVSGVDHIVSSKQHDVPTVQSLPCSTKSRGQFQEEWKAVFKGESQKRLHKG